MKKGKIDTEVTTTQEGELLHLQPSEIQPHPAIKFLEENGAFPISPKDIEKLSESVAGKGFLQPITVMNIDGSYYRIAGRRRTLVAEKLGGTVPCYVRHFDSDNEVIDAWKDENFKRRQYSPGDMLKEIEKIDKIWSKRTVYRAKKALECHPELQGLIKKGIFNMCGDEDLIAALGSLPLSIQQAVASGFNNSTVVKTEYKEKISEVFKDPELKEQITVRDEKITKLEQQVSTYKETVNDLKKEKNELKETLSKHGDNSAQVEDLIKKNEHNMKVKLEEIKAKDKEISDLKIQQYNDNEELIRKIDNIFAKQSNHIFELASRLKKEMEATINLLKDELIRLDPDDPARKENLLVIQDSLNKTKDVVNKKFEAISKVISDNLIKIGKASNN